MKKTFLLIAVAVSSTFALLSCEEGGGTLVNPDGAKPLKCYVDEFKASMDGEEAITKFNYNAKDLLISQIDEESSWKYEYNNQDRLVKMVMENGGKETLNYEYDSKGNISKVKYSSDDDFLGLMAEEYIYTTNENGQVEKVKAVYEDESIDFTFAYDAKNNIKTITADYDGLKVKVLENISFDDKSNIYSPSNISKAYIPQILMGLLFGANVTTYFNANNVLSSKTRSAFTEEEIKTTFKYEYTKEGYPSKIKMTVIVGDDDPQEVEGTYTYKCKQ